MSLLHINPLKHCSYCMYHLEPCKLLLFTLFMNGFHIIFWIDTDYLHKHLLVGVEFVMVMTAFFVR